MKKAYLFLLFVVGCMSYSIAQVTVKGTVVSKADQMPVPGAYIVLKGQVGQGTTTITNFDGEFVIESKQKEGIVEISSLGYKSQILNYQGNQILEVVLQDLASDLDEVVLIGYGSAKKGDLTSAIGTANNVGTITSRPVSNYKDFLQGNIAGVTVLSSGGDPTKTADIKIRGIGTFNSESPLIIVDGMPYSGPEINPNDIKSISVLKDAASAAIYGAQAASGVIVIETKKGVSGKPRIGVNYYSGVKSATNLPTPLTAKQQAEVYNTAADNAGVPRQSAHDATQNPYGQVNRTNWIDAIFRDAKVNNINVDLSGAGEDFNYYTSFAYRNREGLLQGTSSESYNLRVKSDYNLTDKITIGENVYVSRDEAYGTDTDNPYSGTIINAIYMPSASPTRYADGSFSGTAPEDLSQFAGAYGDVYNPLSLLLRPNKKSPRTFGSINAYLKYNVLKGLTFKTNYFYSYSNEEKKEFYGRVPELGRSSNQNSLLQENRTIGKWIWDNQISYDASFGEHNINTTLVYSAQKTTGNFTSIKATGFSSEATYNQYLQNAEVVLKPSNSPFEDALTSAIGRIMYNYGNKYYVSASHRRDESSRLAMENQSDNFSSATLGWRLSKESFFNVNAIDDLKLRASWGQIGNIKSVGYYSFDVPIASRNIVLGDDAAYTSSGSYVARNANPDLKWETVESLDFGLDASLLDHSLNITMDYFEKTTKGMIIKGLADLHQGIAPADVNGGQVKNTGFEIAATYRNKIGAVNYSVNANATSVKNELENLDGYADIGQTIYNHDDSVRGVLKPYQTNVGGELYTPYLIPHLGIFQNQAEIDAYTKDGNLIQPDAKPGDFKFEDVNKDGKISNDDRKYYKAYQPKLTYNFGLNLDYKGFDLGMIFQGVSGVKAFNGYKYTTYNASLSGYNLDNRVLGAWSTTNTNSNIPRLSTKDDNKNFGTASSWYLEDASYLRVKNITLGYTFDKVIMDKVSKGSTLRLYVSGENLATFTNYSGLDPEVGGKGLDVAKYPVARTVSFGLLMSL
ncbi:SusC/RagA family TonB-linked outer membrane protein [Wenyingzhuangia aestuarii]|uniref:SusC/RagA family TonB-linked outer membrane protein n=1 Tax=Wenyingzhuangia aestuarii TaxID=1647582 RepID=UPI001438873F|nr:TonB-dependent receptor [Wenyingzhuangia aestuarii]NJB81360.1 TonB-linked SusC/RagA family outer membrane protein [Wenyingzhuangia aestuarii]